MLYTYKMPTELFFGRGAAGKSGDKVRELGGKKALIVTDKGVLDNGILKPVEASLKDAGIEYVVYSDIVSDPDVEQVAEGTEILRRNGCDLVIGIGGGSSMDCGKAIAAMANNPGKIFDYIGIGKVPNPSLPLIAIPTTAGTGSETTYWAVLTDRKTKLKTGVGGWNLMPAMAILDPQLTVTLPPKITAATGMDALTHAMECYVAKSLQPVSEGIAYHAMKMIARSLRKAVVDGENLDAREDMLMASMMAAMAFNVTRLGNAHALVAPLGANFGVPHGIGNAILLPHVMEFNYLAAPERYTEIARLFGENPEGLPPSEGAYLAVDAVRKLMIDVGIREGLSTFGVEEKHLSAIAKEAHTSGNIAVNPRVTTVEDLVVIAQNALEGI